jgi:hypothetical protein
VVDELLRALPNLPIDEVELQSPPTPEYNCVAWAMGEDDRWWDPEYLPDSYWPPGATRRSNLRGWMEAFRSQGFEPCTSSDPEVGFDKIAVYLRGGTPEHVARQRPSGRWTSKIGGLHDIEHDLHALSDYGEPRLIMRRAVAP